MTEQELKKLGERLAEKYTPNAGQEIRRADFSAGFSAGREVFETVGRISALTFAIHYTDNNYAGLEAEKAAMEKKLRALLEETP